MCVDEADNSARRNADTVSNYFELADGRRIVLQTVHAIPTII